MQGCMPDACLCFSTFYVCKGIHLRVYFFPKIPLTTKKSSGAVGHAVTHTLHYCVLQSAIKKEALKRKQMY